MPDNKMKKVDARWEAMLARERQDEQKTLQLNLQKYVRVENINYQIEAARLMYKLDSNDTYTPTILLLTYLQKHQNIDDCLECLEYFLVLLAQIKKEQKSLGIKTNSKIQNILLAIDGIDALLKNAQFWPEFDAKKTFEKTVQIVKMFEEVWIDPKTKKPFEDKLEYSLDDIYLCFDEKNILLEKYIRESILTKIVDKIFDQVKSQQYEKNLEVLAEAFETLSRYEYIQTRNYENYEDDPLLNSVLQKMKNILDDPYKYTYDIKAVWDANLKVGDAIKKMCGVDVIDGSTAIKGFEQRQKEPINDLHKFIFLKFDSEDPVQFYIDKILQTSEKELKIKNEQYDK